MPDATTGGVAVPTTTSAGAVPVIVAVKPDLVVTRPDLFQPRDVPGGLDHDPAKVRQLVQHWNPDEYDPIAVARDPEDPDRYVVIAGHHRLEALKQLEVPEFAVKVLEGDVNDPEERERLRTQADLSNYAISAPGLIEQVNTVRRLRRLGWDDGRITDRMRLTRRSQLDDLGYLTHVPPDVLYSIAQHRQMAPIAAEIGRGAEKYDLSDETASQLYKQILAGFETTGKVPNRYAVREKLVAARERAQTRAAQPERLEGFGEDLVTAQFADDVRAEHARRKAYSETRRNLTSCQVLADELGVDIAEVQAAANTRLETLTPSEEQRAREIITAPAPTPAPTPPAQPGDDSLLLPFGTPQLVDQPEPIDADPVPAPMPTSGEPQLVAMPTPVKPVCPPAQATMGAEFHTDRMMAMPMAAEMPSVRTPITAPPPRPDPRQASFFDKPKYEQNERTGRFQRVKYTGRTPETKPAPQPPTIADSPSSSRRQSTSRRKRKRATTITVDAAQITYWKPRRR